MLGIRTALISCFWIGCMIAAAGDDQAQAQKVLDPYQIKRTVLSGDGRDIGFDFDQLRKDESLRTRSSLLVNIAGIESHATSPLHEFAHKVLE